MVFPVLPLHSKGGKLRWMFSRFLRLETIFWLAAATIAICIFPFFILQDHSIYFVTGRRLLLGEANPYDVPPVPMIASGLFGLEDGGTLQVWSPPFFLLFYAILGLLSIAQSKAIYGIIFIWLIKNALNRTSRSREQLLQLFSFPIFCVPQLLIWGE